MKKLSLFTLLGCFTFLQANATITINADFKDLRTADPGTLMPEDRLVLLVGSPDATFGGPTSISFITGNDYVLFAGSLNQDGYFQAGFSINLGDNIHSGDLMQLFWFPNLTLDDYNNGAGTPASGQPYGQFRSDVPIAQGEGTLGSIAWTIPATDGAAYNLQFITESSGGPYPDSAGIASFVVPVPEADNYIFGGLALAFVLIKIARDRRRKVA